MHFSGHEVRSLATQRSWRTLIGSSFVILSVRYFGISLDSFTVSELTFPKGAIDKSLLIFHILFLVSYLLSWLGDFVSIGHWNKRDDDDGRSYLELEPSPDVHVKHILSEIKDNLRSGKFTDAHCGRLVGRLEKLDQKYNQQKWYFYIYFYGWYLVFPLIMSISAIYLWFDLGVKIKPTP